MGKHIFEEGPRKGHAAGDTSVEQQASQLASDIKYKAREKMKAKAGSDRSPAQVQALYRQLFNASPAPGPVKAIAKKKLFGEQVDPGIVPVSEHVKDSVSNVFTKVFLGEEEARTVRVTDRATRNTRYVKADRAKVAELRKNTNIASVEYTGHKADPTDAEKASGGKKAKKDYDGDGKVESGSKEHAGAVHNAIQRKKGGVADGKDTRKEEYVDEGLSGERYKAALKKGKQYSRRVSADPAKRATRGGRGGESDFGAGDRGAGNKASRRAGTYQEEYVDEGLRSAVKRLLGKKDAPAEKKPESRGEQLRKKYNVGPEKSDTSAKRQILDRTRAKAERDKKQYGGSVYTKSVADKSKAAHDRYLKGGYSKYGADDARGKGNKARRRAEALEKEDFNWLVDTLISEGYNLSSYTVDQFYDFCEEVIYEKQEEDKKKFDVMKGKNKVNVSPTIGEQIKAELASLSAQRVEEAAAAAAAAGPTPEEKKQLKARETMLKRKMMLQRQAMQMQKQGRLALNYTEEAGAVRYCPKCDKDETRDECKYGGEYWDENSKPTKAMDPREVPTRINLAKNKLRAMGLKMSYDMEGELVDEGLGKRMAAAGAAGAIALGAGSMMGKKVEKDVKQVKSGGVTRVNTLADKVRKRNAMLKQIDQMQSFELESGMTEEASDRARDNQLMRGGMGARKNYNRPPTRKPTNKELGIRDFTPAEKEKRAKEIEAHLKQRRG